MSEELKPCPFCGGEPKLKRHDDTFIVVCEHHEWGKLNADGIRTAGDIAIYADMQGEYNFDTHELEYSPEEIERCKNAAIEAWNTRAERTCRYESTNRCTWVCTSCGREVETRHCGYNYCPNCGARMIEDPN